MIYDPWGVFNIFPLQVVFHLQGSHLGSSWTLSGTFWRRRRLRASGKKCQRYPFFGGLKQLGTPLLGMIISPQMDSEWVDECWWLGDGKFLWAPWVPMAGMNGFARTFRCRGHHGAMAQPPLPGPWPCALLPSPQLGYDLDAALDIEDHWSAMKHKKSCKNNTSWIMHTRFQWQEMIAAAVMFMQNATKRQLDTSPKGARLANPGEPKLEPTWRMAWSGGDT